jgi:hypothetical protein
MLVPRKCIPFWVLQVCSREYSTDEMLENGREVGKCMVSVFWDTMLCSVVMYIDFSEKPSPSIRLDQVRLKRRHVFPILHGAAKC